MMIVFMISVITLSVAIKSIMESIAALSVVL
jgi:hypothetical protein